MCDIHYISKPKNRIIEITAVSYTHLDVYKRQSIDYAFNLRKEKYNIVSLLKIINFFSGNNTYTEIVLYHME